MNFKKVPILSKSRFLAGEQCHLRLWYSCFNRDLATPVSPAQQAIFDTGHEVGELATRLYPEGVLIREELLIYCSYDTLAMVKIRDELIKRF